MRAGSKNATREECLSSSCCFNEHYSPIAQLGPKCFYPANAEISAYFQDSINAQGQHLAAASGCRMTQAQQKDQAQPAFCMLTMREDSDSRCAAFGAQVASAASYAGFEGYGCGWGAPVLAPVPRTNDTWGMGWQNLYDLEVAEMLAADLTQAGLLSKVTAGSTDLQTGSFAIP